MMMTEIPAWPDESSAEGIAFFGRAHAIVAAFKAHGAANATALAMLAMAEAESALDPNAKGDHVGGEPTAFGLFQWHGARLSAIKAQTGVNILASVLTGKGEVQSQCDAAWWELTHFSGYGLKAIESASTASGAAVQATAMFERAGALDAAKRRGIMAERWADYFQRNGF